MPLEPVAIIIVGKHDSGRTTLASLIRMFLEENGYRNVHIEDTEPLPSDQKDKFMNRFMRNKERPVMIRVRTAHASSHVVANCKHKVIVNGECDVCGATIPK